MVKHTPTPQVTDIYVVFKTHFDIGFTDLPSKIIEKYRTTMIDDALAICLQNEQFPPDQRFSWTIPGWVIKTILEDRSNPDRIKKIEWALQNHYLVIHGLPFTMHTEAMEIEDVVRSLAFAVDVSKKYHLPLPRDAKMTDVPSHSWILPTILKHAGIEYLHLGCNAASSSPDVPELFWWEGPDGSRVLTSYASKYYGSDLIPDSDWPYRSWLALIHTNDNDGPPKPNEIKKLLDRAHKEAPGVALHFGRLSDFADAILKDPDALGKIPVIKGDMPDSWIHGVMTMPSETRTARNIRMQFNHITHLQQMCAMWGFPLDLPTSMESIGTFYEKSVLFGEHTWGMDTKFFGGKSYEKEWVKNRTQGKYEKLEASWAEKMAYINDAQQIFNIELTRTLLHIRNSHQSNKNLLLVVNPLPWKREGYLRYQLPSNAGFPPHIQLKDSISNKIIYQGKSSDPIIFRFSDIPASGYQIFPIESITDEPISSSLIVDENAHRIQNKFLDILFDPERGCIKKVIDKTTNAQLIDETCPLGFGEFFEERFGKENVQNYIDQYCKTKPDWALEDMGAPHLPSNAKYQKIKAISWNVQYQHLSAAIIVIFKGKIPEIVGNAIEIRLTLLENDPRFNIEFKLLRKTENSWPNADWLCFPCQIPDPKFQLFRLGGIVDPNKDIIPGSNHQIFCLNGGLAMLDKKGNGLGICSPDSPLISLEQPGLWRYSKTRQYSLSHVYLNLYNNMWGTNFKLWTDETLECRISIWPIHAYQPEKDLITPTLEIRNPPYCLFLNQVTPFTKATDKPELLAIEGLKLSRKGIQVTSFGPNPYGEGVLLRLWELAGSDDPVEISFPKTCNIKSVVACDLRGRPISDENYEINVNSNSIQCQIRKNAPLSLIIRY